MALLSKRHDYILEVLQDNPSISVTKLLNLIRSKFPTISKITLNRDLSYLQQHNLVTHTGKARATVYALSPAFQLIHPVRVKEYLTNDIQARHGATQFTNDIFLLTKEATIFLDEELDSLKTLGGVYQHNIRTLSKTIYKKEMERFTVELSWKSSQIEGNTYTLLETEELLSQKKRSKQRTNEETVMILNHKKTLDYIRAHPTMFETLRVSHIEDIHSLLVDKLEIKKGLRTHPVGITGTSYRPLDNVHQIRDAMSLLVDTINTKQNPFEKALLAMLLIAYLQPFEDGNKRTSRLIGNAILIAHNLCPISYRSAKEEEYKKAVILFYEQLNCSYFKELFIDQFTYAVNHYFQT